MKRIGWLLTLWLITCSAQAQIRIQDPTKIVQRRVETKVNTGVNREMNRGINRGMGKAEEQVSGKKKKEKTPPAEPSTTNTPTSEQRPTTNANTSASNRTTNTETTGNRPADAVSARGTSAGLSGPYSQFDFVPAATVVLAEDFRQVRTGDFPARWNTNSGGEVVTIRNVPGQWLALSKPGQVMPEGLGDLPDEFTLQFNLACSNRMTAASTGFSTAFVSTKNPTKEFGQWTYGRTEGGNAAAFTLHPMDATGQNGSSELIVSSKRDPAQTNRAPVRSFFADGRNLVRVSVSRQQERMRVYINDEKVWDIPHAFQPNADYNALVFAMGKPQDGDLYYLSNLQMAVGAPDTRRKLLKEGRFATHGIHFKPNTDQIKPDSNGALRDIATVLSENPALRIQIVDYTSADEGTDPALARRRAGAVRAWLSEAYGIDATRLIVEGGGRGQSKPLASNNTAAGKANNRRVEFIKL